MVYNRGRMKDVLVVLMGLAGIGGLVALFLGMAGIVAFTTNQMIYLGVVTVVNLGNVGVGAVRAK